MAAQSLNQLYRSVSGKLLNLVVKPKLMGEVPEQTLADTTTETRKKAVCYVLQTQSNSNALLLDQETHRLKQPAALAPLQLGTLHEEVSVFYLQTGQRQSYSPDKDTHFPPRLIRLIEFLQQNADYDIDLIPVTILWGRSPEKEDSLFKLFFNDAWQKPSTMKQLVNIGLHGRDTYLEFHDAMSLRQLLNIAQEQSPNLSPARYIVQQLNDELDGKREAVLGPDLSDRRNVMHSLIKSPDVQDAIRKESVRDKISMQAAEQRAIGYVNEIVSDYSISAIRFADVVLTRLWTQLYDGVEIHNFNQVRDLAQKYEIVYTPCHRSHIDYLLLSYVIFKQGLRVPYIAAGDNLNLPVVGQLLRGGGAFFIRRSFGGNALYTSVFKQYLYSIVSRGGALEYFIEGGRSRTGRLLAPKTGMLAMTAHAYFRSKNTPQSAKPVVFIPTYIGYERLMEGSTYVGEMQGKPKEAESILGIVQSMRKIERIFGQVHVNFGQPVFLDDVLQQHDITQVDIQHNDDPIPSDVSKAINSAALQILRNINSAAVINPVSLLSLALLAVDQHILDEKLCVKLLDSYKQLLHFSPYDESMKMTPLSGQEMIEYGLKLKLIQRSSHVLGNMIAIAKDQAVLLTYFRNNILHAYVLPSLIAALVERNGQIAQADLIAIIQDLYPFLKAEMFLKWSQQELAEQIQRDIDALKQLRLIEQQGEQLLSPAPNSELHRLLALIAAPVQQSLSRYYLTIALIQQRGSGAISSKQVEDLSHLLGQRLSALHESNSPEFFDKALFQGFLKELTRLDYMQTNEQGQLVFGELMSQLASHATLVLDEETQQMLKTITNLSDDELATALAEVATQNAKRRAKRKAK
ncbi:MAG: glycerol-3-phosphate 1-O-acyltransferase PlsB [Acinetobacter sp.]|nr:glycerol-3-phosphate 1-O-acyltransferase PlsB [Acinetobacter sp.]